MQLVDNSVENHRNKVKLVHQEFNQGFQENKTKILKKQKKANLIPKETQKLENTRNKYKKGEIKETN